jgi:hypothetical protein
MNSPSHIEKRISAIIIEKKEKKMKRKPFYIKN